MGRNNVSVSVRLRPMPPGDQENAVSVSGSGVLSVQGRAYDFPHCIITGSDQAAAYNAIGAPLIEKLREGYSCALVAYGQTGSGKTHTIYGPPGCLTETNMTESEGGAPASWGIFPRAALAMLGTPDLGSMHASVVEVYQEKAYDLLNGKASLQVGSKKTGPVKTAATVADAGMSFQQFQAFEKEQEALRQRLAKLDADKVAAKARGIRGLGSDSRDGSRAAGGAGGKDDEDFFSVVGETMWEIKTPSDVARLSRTVEATRTAAGHNLNARSSRSHCLVTVHVTRVAGGRVSRRQFLFADLAGSERISKSGVEGLEKKQATVINTSLTVLTKVIKSLAEGSGHVQWRESTLTMLLKPSFAGRAFTSVVINAASEQQHVGETVSSLDFGKRMSVVKGRAAVVVSGDAGVEEEQLKSVVDRLRGDMERMRARGDGGRFAEGSVPSEVKAMQDNMARHEEEERRILVVSGQLAEARAEGDAQKVASLEAVLARRKLEAANYRDIVLRQRSIGGFYAPPSPAYIKKQSELRQAEAKLEMLSGKLEREPVTAKESQGKFGVEKGAIQAEFFRKMTAK